MSSKPWFPWFPADYQAKTKHLDFIHDSAYRRLLEAQYMAGGPLTADPQKLYRITGARTIDEEQAVDDVVAEYFQNGDGKIRQQRAMEEIERRKAMSEGGKKGAKGKWGDGVGHGVGHGVTDVVGHGFSMLSHNSQPHPHPQELPLSNSTSEAEKPDRVPYQAILDLYHMILPELPRVLKLTNSRAAQVRARWKGKDAEDLADWSKFFHLVRLSKFLMGRSPPQQGRRVFIADFGWLTKEENFVKVIEGKYP